MSPFHDNSSFDGITNNLDATYSRRRVITQLATLGLVAGGSALFVLDAEAKRKHHGKPAGNGKAKSKKDRKPQAPSAGGNSQNNGLSVQAVALPRISHYQDSSKPPVLTIKSTQNGIYEVAIGAAIRFAQEHINEMDHDGIQYAVSCNAMEADPSADSTSLTDRNNGDDFLFYVPKKNSQSSWFYYFPSTAVNLNRVGSVPFIWKGAGSRLQQDDDQIHNVYAELLLWVSNNDQEWRVVSSTKTNRQDGEYR